MNLIDMHCDTIWKLMENPCATLLENAFGVDIGKLKKAKSAAQFFACFVYMKQFSGEERYTKGYEYAKKMIRRGKEEISRNQTELALAVNAASFWKNRSEGKISAFLTIEEGGILENKLDRLTELYEEKIRLITLLWNEENCIGFPNSREKTLMEKGLKPFGFEVVEQMNRLQMLIDVSHLSDGGFWDVLQNSKAPVVASHSNARSLCNNPRNLTDEMIRALAENGGVAGLNFYPFFIHSSGKATIEQLSEHILHMMKIGGEDVVAIGTDFDGFDDGETEITQIGQIVKLAEALQKRGGTQRQLEKIWSGNVLRVVQEVL